MRDPAITALAQAAIPDLEGTLHTIHQILQKTQEEWKASGAWSEFDQGVMDRLESAQRLLAVCTGNTPRGFTYSNVDAVLTEQATVIAHMLSRKVHRGMFMPIINCPSCGKKTNTALCPGWHEASEGRTAKCVARLVPKDGDWVYEQGCGYAEAEEFDRHFANSVIRDTAERAKPRA